MYNYTKKSQIQKQTYMLSYLTTLHHTNTAYTIIKLKQQSKFTVIY